jgi:hypothetical protein
VTHHAREPLPLEGGTTFFFVTDGVEAALQQAEAAANGKDVVLAGGASIVQQALRLGAVDEVGVSSRRAARERNAAPGRPAADTARAHRGGRCPGVAHLRYRVKR